MIVYKELKSIEKELGFSSKTLYGLSNNLGKHYHKVEVPKKSGGTRTLSIPDEALKKVQRAIVQSLLEFENVSFHAKAYKYNSSITKNASPHVGKKKILKLDIYRFFDNISYSTVKEKVFPAEKYSEQIRILLSMLCYYNEALPQGAPTSPIITNILMREFDNVLGEWCKKRNVDYTRYCDDMTFSGSFDEKEIIDYVIPLLCGFGLILNDKKTKVFTSSQKQIVTGIVVNKKMNVSKAYKREIRKEVYFCKKFGVENHIEHEEIQLSPERYLNSLLGRINFVLQVCKNDKEFKEYKKIISKIIKNK